MLMEVLLLLFTLQKWITEDQMSKAIEAVEGGDKKASPLKKAPYHQKNKFKPDFVFVCAIPSQSTARSSLMPGTSHSRPSRCVFGY